jgi:hypothetical protein
LKKILIISPHYPPSNLTAVHRSRLFAKHLPSFGWNPIILTVHEDYYEESLDWNLHKLLPLDQRIEKVKAFNITRPRLIGDIGLRAFFQLRKRALEIILNEKIDFVYIPIPSFYTALIGPYLNKKTGIKYGIDYIDPWVHIFPGSNKLFSRHWFSTQIAKILEPIAVKCACLITGISESYYESIFDRNPNLKGRILLTAMPYGLEPSDYDGVLKMNMPPYLFKKSDRHKIAYAGTLLPKSHKLLEKVFQYISINNHEFKQVEFHFIGTGSRFDDPNSFTVKPIAEKFGLWQSIVFEYPKRIPYLDVLSHLSIVDSIFILGSTEPHYSPSKLFLALLSKKPVFSILHARSQAIEILKRSNASLYIPFSDIEMKEFTSELFLSKWREFIRFVESFDSENIPTSLYQEFSAKSMTSKLVESLNKVTRS